MKLLTATIVCLAAVLQARAAIQFDVFLGYDGVVSEASWFPVVCEIKNDEATFKGTIELSGGAYNQGQTLRTEIELPRGTLKRLVLPVFSSSRGFTTWDLKLMDERGKVRAEQNGVRPRKLVARGTPVLGAISRTAAGTPIIRPVLPQATELQPVTARMLATIFPDNPLTLEGMSSLYLNSERAADLSVSQVNAILAWLNVGGHLIVGVEQPADVSASPWLKALVPVDVKDLRPLEQHPELQDWVRHAKLTTNAVPAQGNQVNVRRGNRYPGQLQTVTSPIPQSDVEEFFERLPLDLTFEAAPIQVAVGQVREGQVEIASGDTPLAVSVGRGRGKVTLLLFSPEREPVRSWKNLDMFWAKLADVPGAYYVSKDFNLQGGWSSDGIFGAMIDTRQVHKLPIGWLLLLLVAYLVVIGPLDQYWLKRIGKPMLTWITFPCYVVAFSLVIYVIGYKLRAGESEWNELHVVDVLKKTASAELRGRTYSSVYSPSNQRYTLESQLRYATLRSEFVGFWGGGQSSEKATILQTGDNFRAEIFVPVWTSELYITDWWQSAATPLEVSVHAKGDGWEVRVENRTDRNFPAVQLVVDHRIASVGQVPANEVRTVTIPPEKATSLANFVMAQGGGFQGVVTSRQRALGASERGQLSDLPNTSVAASFLSQLYQQQYENRFISPPGLDLSRSVDRGDAIVLAWADDYSPVSPSYRFTPRRSQKHTLWRVTVPVQ